MFTTPAAHRRKPGACTSTAASRASVAGSQDTYTSVSSVDSAADFTSSIAPSRGGSTSDLVEIRRSARSRTGIEQVRRLEPAAIREPVQGRIATLRAATSARIAFDAEHLRRRSARAAARNCRVRRRNRRSARRAAGSSRRDRAAHQHPVHRVVDLGEIGGQKRDAHVEFRQRVVEARRLERPERARAVSGPARLQPNWNPERSANALQQLLVGRVRRLEHAQHQHGHSIADRNLDLRQALALIVKPVDQFAQARESPPTPARAAPRRPPCPRRSSICARESRPARHSSSRPTAPTAARGAGSATPDPGSARALPRDAAGRCAKARLRARAASRRPGRATRGAASNSRRRRRNARSRTLPCTAFAQHRHDPAGLVGRLAARDLVAHLFARETRRRGIRLAVDVRDPAPLPVEGLDARGMGGLSGQIRGAASRLLQATGQASRNSRQCGSPARSRFERTRPHSLR